MWTNSRNTRRGGALLAVLWLSAALAAIAFSLATTVRGEAERTSTAVDSLRSYYLATGAIERAIVRKVWPTPTEPGADDVNYRPGVPMRFVFPSGEAVVDFVPETAKLNVNLAPVNELATLLLASGVEPGRAEAIAQAIVETRSPGQGGFDPLSMTQNPSFRTRRASLEEIEELLYVRGVTPDLFYGTYDRHPETGRLVARAGLVDCLSVFGSGAVDVNYAPPAVMTAVGVPPAVAAMIVERRRMRPITKAEELAELAPLVGPAFSRLRIGGNSIFTLRATASLRLADGQLSDVRRSAAAMLKIMPPGYDAPYHILRWHDFVLPREN